LKRFRLRLWLDDRPGALGAVASRIGSVKGDLVGIEILERGGGKVVDDLIVELESDSLIELMIKEILEVDGVAVEYVKDASVLEGEGALIALRFGAELGSYRSFDEKTEALVKFLHDTLDATWTAAIDIESGHFVCIEGEPPKAEWLVAFVKGATYEEATGDSSKATAPKELTCASINGSKRAIVLMRTDHAFREAERQQIQYLSAILSSYLQMTDA
jgi:hypothetical protein